jgi:anti-sigma B factor antagonist
MQTPIQRLRLMRMPGESGPTLHCIGEFNMYTIEAFRRELDLLASLAHPAITLDLTGCTSLDVDGILAILEGFRRVRGRGRNLVVVAGPGRVARLLSLVGLDYVIPVFPTGTAAELAVRGGLSLLPERKSWAEVRQAALGRWRLIEEELRAAPGEEVLRLLTAMTELCERSQMEFDAHPIPAGSRCQFCPLYYTLGGRSQDIGCRSAIDPLIGLVRSGDREAATRRAGEMAETIAEMPLPEESARTATAPPTDGWLSHGQEAGGKELQGVQVKKAAAR